MNQRVLIIGGTSGIGKAIATLLINSDYNVIITGRRSELLTELKDLDPSKVHIFQMDVNKTEQLRIQLHSLAQTFKRIDLIIFCAGIGKINMDLDNETELQTIQTNICGFTTVATWATLYFQSLNAGHFVAITSVGGIRGSDLAPAYNASKAYQINYLEGMMKRYSKQRDSIFVTDIRAGLMDTAMAKGDGLFWVAPVHKAALQIYNAILKKKKVAYVTKRWGIVSIFLKIVPKKLYLKAL